MNKKTQHIQLHDMMRYLKAVVASLVLCFTIQGCDKEIDESETPVDDNTIGFNAGVEKSRAVVGSISDVQDNGGFSVWGSYANSDGTLQKVFNGDNVYWSNNTWTYDATKYWNPGKTYNFFAVYPKAQNTVSLSDDGESYKLTFQLPAKADVDLLAATSSITAEKDKEGNFSVVAFRFDHILSKININIQKNGANDKDKVIVRSVSVNNINKSGSYNSKVGTWNDFTIGSFSSSNNLNIELGVDDNGDCVSVPVISNLLLIPQKIEEESIQLSITYSIQDDKSIDLYTADAFIPNTNIDEWEKQKAYTYNVILGEAKNNILFGVPEVQDWIREKQVGGSVMIQ